MTDTTDQASEVTTRTDPIDTAEVQAADLAAAEATLGEPLTAQSPQPPSHRNWHISQRGGWDTSVSVTKGEHILINQQLVSGKEGTHIALTLSEAEDTVASLLSAINTHREWSA